MIEYIEDFPILDKDGNIYGMTVATNSQLMEKVNEIIETLNTLSDRIEILEKRLGTNNIEIV